MIDPTMNGRHGWLIPVAASIAAGLLTDCATKVEEGPPPRQITCRAGPDCDAKWSRAISWIATKGHWKIETQTDLLVQTHNSTDSSTNPSFTATKVARGNGVYEISFTGGCDNPFRCTPTIADARASFADFVMAQIDLPAQAPPAARR